MAMPERELDQAKRHPDVVKNIIKKDGRKDAIPYSPSNPPPATEGGRIWYATCSTAAGTGAKTATSSTGDFVLQTGAMVRLKCTTANTASNPTISIDGSTAKTIQPKSGTSGMAYRWRAQEVIDLVYDGSNFIMSLGPEADTSFYGITKLNSATNSTSTTEAATPSAVKAAYDLAGAKVDRAGDTMSGNLVVQKPTGCWVGAASSNYGTSVSLTIANPNHGVYSEGYYDGSVFHSAPKWLISRDGAGNVIVNGHSTDDFNLQQGTNIPNNSDLDNYTTPGSYYVLSSTEAATISHGPITATGYKLIVMVGSIADRRHQIAIRQSSNQIYVRNYSGSVWSAWERAITSSQVNAFNLSGQKTFTANTWEYSGVSVSIPAGAIYGVWSLNGYAQARPTGTAISRVSDNINLWDLVAISEAQPMIATATGYTSSAVTLYVWGRCNAAGKNTVYLNGWYYVV